MIMVPWSGALSFFFGQVLAFSELSLYLANKTKINGKQFFLLVALALKTYTVVRLFGVQGRMEMK